MPRNFACRVQAVNLLVANSLEYETYHWQPCARFVNPNIRYLVIYLYLVQGMPYAAFGTDSAGASGNNTMPLYISEHVLPRTLRDTRLCALFAAAALRA